MPVATHAAAEPMADPFLMMPDSATNLLLLAVLCALIVVVVLLLRGQRGGDMPGRIQALDAEIAENRERQTRLERDLAAKSEAASRVPLLEAELRTRTEMERDLAVGREALSRVEQVNADLRSRLSVAEHALKAETERLDAAARQTAQLEAKIADLGAMHRNESVLNQDLQARLGAAEDGAKTARAELSAVREQLAALKETLDQERRLSVEKIATFNDMRGQLTAEFKLLANDVLKTHGETFSKSNQEQIDGLLNPMRHRLTEFQDVLRLANEQTIRERAALGEQIKSLSDASGRMSTETLNLTRALKGEAQAQGAWGEMILASILERSGLIKGEQYFTQESHTGEEGGRLRPDVIVRLPGDLQVIVDSKVSLVAFEAHVAAETDEDRTSALNRHVASIRGHIRGLSGKKYQDLGSNDFVVMFIPIEGALALALQRDPEITSHAVANNVAIATPTTLMIALRTVANVWQVENRNRNAEEIAKRAGLLYDKFVGFTEDMLTLRKRLDDAAKSHDDAMNKLSTGSGNLVRQAVLLRALGAKAGSKQIAAALLDDTAAATATE